MEKARMYQTEQDSTVRCGLCNHRCVIKPGHRGICGVRENRGGVLYSLVYGAVAAEHVDPVEKKPLFHFLPGTRTYSLATAGCNFKCLHCQNYSLSQADGIPESVPSHWKSPDDVVGAAVAAGCQSISYTYSEPTVFYEFAYDCSLAAQEAGLRNVFVSNGYMSREAALMLAPVLGAINIDIKAFTERFYATVCRAKLQPVLDNVSFFREQGVWVEVTTLIIPGLNDSDEELRDIASFLVALDPNIPWHVSAFFPTFKMLDRRPTPPVRLLTARDIGLTAGLRHVYVGNIINDGGEQTDCPACGKTVIKRSGFTIVRHLLENGCCPFCSAPVAGVWS